MMLEFGLKYPRFYLDFVKLNVKYKANDELLDNLIKMMRYDSRLKHLSVADLLNINGQVEMFVVGVIYVYSVNEKYSEEILRDLKEATKTFIFNFIKGYVG